MLDLHFILTAGIVHNSAWKSNSSGVAMRVSLVRREAHFPTNAAIAVHPVR